MYDLYTCVWMRDIYCLSIKLLASRAYVHICVYRPH